MLDRTRPRRAFRRLVGAALTALLPAENRAASVAEPAEAGGDVPPDTDGPGEPADGE